MRLEMGGPWGLIEPNSISVPLPPLSSLPIEIAGLEERHGSHQTQRRRIPLTTEVCVCVCAVCLYLTDILCSNVCVWCACSSAAAGV